STGLVAFSLIGGQEKPSTVHLKESQSTPLDGTAKSPGQPDLSRLSLLQQQMYLSAQRGAEWLRRANRQDGRFASGYIPALKTPLEGDHYLPQIGATLALARAGHFLRDEQYMALARQAVLTLLLDTASEPSNPTLRYTTFPPIAVNRLGAAGLLVAAINELPTPGTDLLEQSEQLSAFIRTQQATDGAFN